MFDVVAMGELLIDFTQNGTSSQGNIVFEANPGGAPCNVLAMLSKLLKKTAFIGKVGNDFFGKTLRNTLRKIGIDDDGDRDFTFYRNPGADMMLNEEEIKEDLLENTKVFHFGTLSMTHEVVMNATKKVLNIAKQNGTLISFDPNLRKQLWDDLTIAKEAIDYGASQCNIMKIEEDEVRFLMDNNNLDEAIILLRRKYPNIKLLFVTFGINGAGAYYKEISCKQKAYLEVNTIDTTGAGDTFCGSCLAYLLENPIDQLTEEKLNYMLKFANSAASLVTTKKGAINSMPNQYDIEELLNS